jgi:phage terminase small subunit
MVCCMYNTVIHPVSSEPAPGALAVAQSPGEFAAASAALATHAREPTLRERKAAELFVLYRSKIRAYREAFDVQAVCRPVDYNNACNVFSKPAVLAYVRELTSAAAQAVSIDVQALLEADRAIVEAANHAEMITRHEWHNCRWCNGIDHAHQWIDENEYATALAAWMDVCAATPPDKRSPPQPTDDGGYGFVSSADPNVQCPRCEGRGVQHTIIADTDKLGPAAPLYRGMKVTKNGIEVLLHDVDKAKDRLYRATGAYGDDAASVARGAAAGAAAGASAAAALAAKVSTMTADEARKAYLGLVNP